MYTKPVSPQPIGSVLDNGFSLYRHSLKDAFVFAFLSAFLTALINRMVLATITAETFDIGLLAVSWIATMAVTIFFYTPVVATIYAVQHGARLAPSDALALGTRRFFIVLGVVVLYSLAVFAGTLLLIIPGIFIAVALVFSTIPAIAESKGVIESLRYSFELVKGRWWRTAILLTIISIVLLVLYFLVVFIVGLMVAFGQGDVEGQVPWTVELLVTPLVVGVLSPLFYAMLMAAYAETKLRYEGADIAERIAAAQA
jgi:hypothetical protein